MRGKKTHFPSGKWARAFWFEKGKQKAEPLPPDRPRGECEGVGARPGGNSFGCSGLVE